jgi:hypothetical protein
MLKPNVQQMFNRPRNPSHPEVRPEAFALIKLGVKTMGLEPTTPCLQIRPTWTPTNSDERLREISAKMRTATNGCGRLRMRHECAIVDLALGPGHHADGFDRMNLEGLDDRPVGLLHDRSGVGFTWFCGTPTWSVIWCLLGTLARKL